MGFISWLVLGLLAGAIAKKIMPGKDPGGCLVTTALGVAGAMLGGLVSSAAFGVEITKFFSPYTWVFSILGSLALLAGYRVLAAKFGQEDRPVVERPEDREDRS